MKAVIDEVNIHKEDQKTFEDVFNVRKVSKTHGVYEVKVLDGIETEKLLSKDSILWLHEIFSRMMV
jgi:hypothetical protein